MESLKITKPFLKDNKILLIFYIICILLSYPLESIILPRTFSKFFSELKSDISNTVLIKYFKILFVFMTIITIAQIINSRLDTILITKFNESVSNIFYTKIIKFYENNYKDLELGKLTYRINSVPTVLREITTDLVTWILPKILTVVIINCYFFKINFMLGLISILFITGITYYNLNYSKPCINLSNQRYNTYEQKSEFIQDRLSNLYSVYSTGNTNTEIDNYKVLTKKFKDIQYSALNCIIDIKTVNTIGISILFLLLCSWTVYIYKQNKIKSEDLVSIFMTLLFYIQGLNTIANFLPDYSTHLGILNSINDYISEINYEEIEKPNITIDNGTIQIKNLSFKYPNGKTIFNNFNLFINNNEKIGIIGSSGNGKSTLIKLIMGYYKVSDNTIFINNQDINSYNLKSLRQQISYINQNTKLFNKSIYDNIKYGNTLTNEEIDNIFIKYNLDRVFNNINKNISVGVNGDELSGGQKQIIQLLRIYNKNNKILILDEPTSALDIETKNIFINLIKEISINSTLIVITHDESNLDLVNRIIKIQNGNIIN